MWLGASIGSRGGLFQYEVSVTSTGEGTELPSGGDDTEYQEEGGSYGMCYEAAAGTRAQGQGPAWQVRGKPALLRLEEGGGQVFGGYLWLVEGSQWPGKRDDR